MPAAVILVNPADAIDCKFLDLNFLKDTQLFTARYFQVFNFHGNLLSLFVTPNQMRCGPVVIELNITAARYMFSNFLLNRNFFMSLFVDKIQYVLYNGNSIP